MIRGSQKCCQPNRAAKLSIFTLRWALFLIFTSFYLTEIAPLPLSKLVLPGSDLRQVFLLIAMCSLTVSVALVYYGCRPSRFNLITTKRLRLDYLIALLSIVPIPIWVATTLTFLLQGDCPGTRFVQSNNNCSNRWAITFDFDDNYWSVLCDTFGLVTARLARLNFGLCILLAACGKWPWLHGATAGRIGYPNGMPLHRIAGYWCFGLSVAHSLTYFAFYYIRGGWLGIWQKCLPTAVATVTVANATGGEAKPYGMFNRIGLINGFGVFALGALLMTLVPALPYIRQRWYNFFQYLHLPTSMIFILFSALHDLQWLYFGIPGLSEWFLGLLSDMRYLDTKKLRISGQTATVQLLSGTSGPWVELKIDITEVPSGKLFTAPGGQWASLRVVQLGCEFHPVSVVRTRSHLFAWVTANGGDWSSALARFADSHNKVDIQIRGIFPEGSISNSFSGEEDTVLLLLAGGTGVAGWIPLLHGLSASRRCHLVWCVQQEADYLSLARLLPQRWEGDTRKISVFITRAPATIDPALLSRVDKTKDNHVWSLDTVQAQQPSVDSWLSLVSLASTIVSLFVCYWCWSTRVTYDASWIKLFHLGTTVKYGLVFRLLPVVFTVLSILMVCIVGRYAGGAVKKTIPQGCCGRRGSVPLLHPTNSADYELDSQITEQQDSEHQECPADHLPRHQLQSGRPNVSSLVQDAVAALAATDRLEVAAQGPPSLVMAAREAILTLRKKSSVSSRVEFFGAESRW